jgi:hypothetical protein
MKPGCSAAIASAIQAARDPASNPATAAVSGMTSKLAPAFHAALSCWLGSSADNTAQSADVPGGQIVAGKLRSAPLCNSSCARSKYSSASELARCRR